MTRLSGMIGMTLAIASTMASAQERSEVPTVYEAGHFYATPTLADGTRLRLVVDTGGGGSKGWFVLHKAVATRLNLPIERCPLGDEALDVVSPFHDRDRQALPVHNDTPCGQALVIPDSPNDHEDGQLGTGYLPGHVWTFDYPAGKLWLEAAHWQPTKAMRRVALGFPRNAQGILASGFPRISIQVNGDTLNLLLDTGATAQPTTAGKVAGTEVASSGIGVASYITTRQLERWHHAHPEWRVVDHGDDLIGDARLIEVPRVEIGGWMVGPVWFTERPNQNFELPGGISKYMDGEVSGALGANALRHFVMTIDYPSDAAWFACASGCTAAKGH